MTFEKEQRQELPRRCAWCERVSVGGQWIAARREGDAVLAHATSTTHTICEDCVEKLRRSGLSV
jgi:hypothetical protein